MKKILLHICCGPCAISVIEKLKNQGYKVIGYFYNPNIQPKSEYLKRLKSLRKLAKIIFLKLKIAKYNTKDYTGKIKNFERPTRCFACYELRLEKTAQKAKTLGIKYFASTLLISPYQNLKKIRQIGQKLAQKYNLKFIDQDFVKDFRQSHQKAREFELYLQKYCGCLSSLVEK